MKPSPKVSAFAYASLLFAAWIAPLPIVHYSQDCAAESITFTLDSSGFSVTTIYMGDGWFYDTYFDVWHYDPYYRASDGEWRYDPLLCLWIFVCFSSDDDIRNVAIILIAASIIADSDCALTPQRCSRPSPGWLLLAVAIGVSRRRRWTGSR